MVYFGVVNSFTFKEYRLILSTIKNAGYKTVFFDEFEPNENYQVLLRHDIDYDWLTAKTLALIEYELGMKSTYFFMFNGRYNLLSNELQLTIKELRELNHEIGLHYDRNSILEFGNGFFGMILGKCNVISNHRPAENKYKNLNEPNQVKLNAYDNKFAWDIKYYSDSNRKWKYGYPLDKLDGANFQLLIHPLWWNEKPFETKNEAYIEFMNRITKNWNDQFDNDELFMRIYKTIGEKNDDKKN